MKDMDVFLQNVIVFFVVIAIVLSFLLFLNWRRKKKSKASLLASPASLLASPEPTDPTHIREQYRPGYSVAHAIHVYSSVLILLNIIGAFVLGVVLFDMEKVSIPVVIGGAVLVFGLLSAALIIWLVSGYLEWMLRSNLDQTVILAESGRRST